MTRPDPIYLTEGQIAQRVGMTALEWQAVARTLERSGLPLRDPLFGDRRHWPAVRAWLDRRAGIVPNAPVIAQDGEENWDEPKRRAPRTRQKGHEAPQRAP